MSTAYKSPITLGIVVGYVLGKPIGIAGMSWLVTAITHRKLRPPVGWAAVAGAGSIAGIGFTVSLLIASLAFTGTQLQEAKAGVLAAAVLASLLTWVLFRVTERLPTRQRIIALLGRSEAIVDLADPVDVERDHIRGPQESLVTLLEYGDLECPYCGQAEPIVRELLSEFGDIRYVWRHLPLTEVHPNAQLAAEATEAADAQGAFWEMHDLLFQHQDALGIRDLIRYAGELGLDVERFTDDVKHHVGAARVASDVDSADLSKVSGTPTFFVNGIRHHGAYDITSRSRRPSRPPAPARPSPDLARPMCRRRMVDCVWPSERDGLRTGGVPRTWPHRLLAERPASTSALSVRGWRHQKSSSARTDFPKCSAAITTSPRTREEAYAQGVAETLGEA